MVSSIEYETKLLSKLVRCKTDSEKKSEYAKCASILINESQKCGLDAEIIDGEMAAKDGLPRPNVVVTLDSGSDVTLLLESHFDVVSPGPNWSYLPFELTIQDGKAYGRGAADNKSGIAVAVGAMKILKKKKIDMNIKLVATVDEEVGGRYGINYVLNEYGLEGDAALVLDSGPECLYLGASGIIWGRILIEGIQGHAGYPFKARNAIDEAVRFINAMDEYKKVVEKKESNLKSPPNSPRKLVWGRFTITMIKCGEKENIVPGKCELRFDRRLIPEESLKQAEEELKFYFRKAIEKSRCTASLEIINRNQGYKTSENCCFVNTLSSLIKQQTNVDPFLAAELGGNDGSFFSKKGIPVLCYGPIRSDTRFHGIDEFVYLEDMRNIRNLLLKVGREDKSKICNC